MAQSDLIPAAPAESMAVAPGNRSIGAILIDAGRLKVEDAELILRHQREAGLPFGDAAIKLGLLTPADVDFALARQFSYPYLLRGQSSVSEEVIAAYAPFSPQVEALRALRSQLMLRWFGTDPEHKALAIVGSEHGDGRSYIAANLAVVFSQLGAHTLLIDADLRNPCQHRLFGVSNRLGLSAVLSGRGGRDSIQRVPGLLDLSVLPAGARPPNPSELLGRSMLRRLVKELAGDHDVIILDTSPAGETSDALNVSICTGAALIVVRKNAARVWQLRGVAEGAEKSSVTLVGTVLNDY